MFKRLHKPSWTGKPETTTLVLILAIVSGFTVVGLALLAYRASQESTRNAKAVVEQRVNEVTTLLIAALARDMRGAQASILTPFSVEQFSRPDYELSDLVSRAFSRFPYPESFFVWSSRAGAPTLLFNRIDRLPAWEEESRQASNFPVTIIRDSPVAGRLTELARRHSGPDVDLALFETEIDGSRYQVVSRVLHRGESRNDISGIVGFTVNLNWVRSGYFPELASQIESIDGKAAGAGALSLSIIDDQDALVTQTLPVSASGPLREGEFPLAFFDSSSASIAALANLPLRRWKARVGSAANDPLMMSAAAGARRTLLLILFATVTAVACLVLAIRLLFATLDLVAMKADFVTMVSHELKTPLASIHLVGDTLSKGRYSSTQAVAEYGALVSEETSRLTRLIENVLTFSRITDSKSVYRMVDVDVGEALQKALSRLQPQIEKNGFELKVDVPALPNVYGDREAIINVFENVIVNAIRHSERVRRIEIGARVESGRVSVSVGDLGKGILPEDLPYVFTKFFKGKNAGFGGSGLGLAIAKRIVNDHRGDIFIKSVSGRGTTVTVVLPASEVAE